jgi:hypothetical protein
MYAGVPIVDPVFVAFDAFDSSRKRAIPKSSTFTLSRARQENVLGLDVAMDDPLRMGGDEHVEQLIRDGEHVVLAEPPAEADAPLFERLSVEELHEQKRGAIIVGVVVGDFDGSFVPDAVCDVRFAQEPLAHERVGRQLVVQDLNGDAAAVAMRRGVDCRHSA